MDIKVSNTSIRKMANRLRHAIGTDVVSHSKALEALSQVFGAPNWDTLSAKLKPQKIASPILQESAVLYVDTFACNEFGEDPEWATLHLDQEFLGELLKLRQVCLDSGLSHVAVDWDAIPWETGGAFQLENDSLYVTAERWWFRANPRHMGEAVETRAVKFEDLLSALKGEDTPTLAWRDGKLYSSVCGDIEFLVKQIHEKLNPEEADD
jgi:hypothetical protein